MATMRTWNNGVISTHGTILVNQNEYFRVRSDGYNIIWERKTNGVWINHFSMPIFASQSEDFQFFVNAAFLQNTWTGVITYRGSWQGNVNVDWSTPDGGSLSGVGNTRCFTANSAGDYRICVSTDFNEPLCVPIKVEPLYFRPRDGECGDCVFSGELIKFESNGVGILTADIGTIIDNSTWLVPKPADE